MFCDDVDGLRPAGHDPDQIPSDFAAFSREAAAIQVEKRTEARCVPFLPLRAGAN
jgi:hypothetical protein